MSGSIASLLLPARARLDGDLGLCVSALASKSLDPFHDVLAGAAAHLAEDNVVAV